MNSRTPITVPDAAYGVGWDGSLEVPTKNAVYDKIQTISGGSGIVRSINSIAVNTTLGSTASTDYVYFVTALATPTLPTAVGNTNLYTIKNNHSASITINTTSSQTIDGTTTITLASGASVDLVSNNANWFVI